MSDAVEKKHVALVCATTYTDEPSNDLQFVTSATPTELAEVEEVLAQFGKAHGNKVDYHKYVASFVLDQIAANKLTGKIVLILAISQLGSLYNSAAAMFNIKESMSEFLDDLRRRQQ